MSIKYQHPKWSENLTIYEVNLRQYTEEGTFKAFEAHLPRLKELGVGILWFMPIQPIGEKKRKGELGSYYSIKNYTAVNPEFGTLEEFKELVQKIHDMGMYVLLDWVANHTAWDHHWGDSNPEFFHKDANGNFKSPVPEWEDVMHLNYDCPELTTAMIGEMKFWLREANIDGFRCDMAHLVRTSFWNEVREELEKERNVFMLAESENWDLTEEAFDMIYSWKFHHVSNSIARGERCVWDIDHLLESEILNFPRTCFHMYFTSNHDENSWHGSAVTRYGDALEVTNALMFTIDGMPLIYSGQEAGMWQKLAFFDKEPICWQKDKMAEFYKQLTDLRKRNAALWSGEAGGLLQRVYTTNGHDIFAFIREKNGQQVFVILNFSGKEQNFTLLDGLFTGSYQDIFTKETVVFEADAEYCLKAWDYRIFELA